MSAQCEYNNLQNQTDVSDLSSVVAPTIFSSVHPVMPPQRLHIVISVSVPCQPVWIPSLKSWCRDNRAPLFWISLSSSFHPTLLLCVSKTRFLMPTGSDGREQVSLVSSYAKKKKKHDNDNSQWQRFSRSTNARHALKWSLLCLTLRLRGGRDEHTEGRREQTLPLITSVPNQRQWAT